MVYMATLCMATNYAETDSLITETTTPVSVNSRFFPNKPTDPLGGIHENAAASTKNIVSNPPKEISDVDLPGKVDSTYLHDSLSERHTVTSEPIPTWQSYGITKSSDTTLLPEMDERKRSPLVLSTGSVLYSEPKGTNSVDMAKQRSNESQAAEAYASVAFVNISDYSTYLHEVDDSSEENSMSSTLHKQVSGMSRETQETNLPPSSEEQESFRMIASSLLDENGTNADAAVSSRQHAVVNSSSSGDGVYHASPGNITKILPASDIQAGAASLAVSSDAAPCSVLSGKAKSDAEREYTIKHTASSEQITEYGASTDDLVSGKPADTFRDALVPIAGNTFKVNSHKTEAVISGQVREPAYNANGTSRPTALYTKTPVDSAESFEQLRPEDKGDVTLNTSHNTAVETATQPSNVLEENGGHIKPARWTNPSESPSSTDLGETARLNSSDAAPEERDNVPSPPVALRIFRIKLFKRCKRELNSCLSNAII
ncbi:unnamed protein product [Dibothriocephalus latus]|uniref:Uncharacterized protein n=1 Tax=Dibothriocephalus latus TaxID=60516 RepID=A0A3P6TB51_DIBLA|nr:unnamed protein product [Dibothriocephalus latus]